MRKLLFIGIFYGLLVGLVAAQTGKRWTDWSEKDADKILNNSAWGQSQTRGEEPPSLRPPSGAGTQATRQGPAPLPPEVFVRARFISAKPVREAFASRLRHSHPSPTAELEKELQTIIDNGFGDYIIVAVNVDGRNPATVRATLQGLRKLDPSELPNKVYLERKDGKRLSVIDYRSPVADDMGGKFVFPRSLDGQPFLTPESGSVRFVMNLSDNLKVNMKFDIPKMMYDGKLEY
jgi:hypothetical protein